MLNWLAHLLHSPLLPWPLSSVHLLPFFSLPPLSSLTPFCSPPPLFGAQAISVYFRAFSFIVQLQGYISMLISPRRDWILKGRGLRRRWAAEGERDWERLIAELSGPGSMGERRPPGSVMAGWESLHPSAPKHDYTWHCNDTGGCLIYFRVTKREKARQREKWKTKERSWRKKEIPPYSLFLAVHMIEAKWYSY